MLFSSPDPTVTAGAVRQSLQEPAGALTSGPTASRHCRKTNPRAAGIDQVDPDVLLAHTLLGVNFVGDVLIDSRCRDNPVPDR